MISDGNSEAESDDELIVEQGSANKMKVTAALFARSPITRIKRQDHTYKVQKMLILVVIIVVMLLLI